jgi:hypothetical protein
MSSGKVEKYSNVYAKYHWSAIPFDFKGFFVWAHVSEEMYEGNSLQKSRGNFENGPN